MKSFAEWLVENKKEINEISSELLGRAEDAAKLRNDGRGERLQNKFSDAKKSMVKTEFLASPTSIEFNIKPNSEPGTIPHSRVRFSIDIKETKYDDKKLVLKGKAVAMEENGEVVDSVSFIPNNLYPSGKKDIGVMNATLTLEKYRENSSYTGYFQSMFLKGRVESFSRMDAMKLTKILYSWMGEHQGKKILTPTMLPMA
jgi:hypothetical protein